MVKYWHSPALGMPVSVKIDDNRPVKLIGILMLQGYGNVWATATMIVLYGMNGQS